MKGWGLQVEIFYIVLNVYSVSIYFQGMWYVLQKNLGRVDNFCLKIKRNIKFLYLEELGNFQRIGDYFWFYKRIVFCCVWGERFMVRYW